ncbi:MAG: DUF4160 domain-containing protein, partial [Deltaproteobacteria bacterium]|nr:DUF4160 domain-containing protein [Deltaproteobacteria bacterium]
KFWLRPIALASSTGFAGHELRRLEAMLEYHRNDFEEAWNEFFGA